MHRSCFSLLQMLLPILLALSGSAVKAATQDQEWAQERANAVLSLMTFTVVPDITASNLDIGSGTNQSAALNMTQIGGGCSGQLNPDTWLGRTSAFAGVIPSLC
ncbi:hypothetical protein [Aeromonas veronii]|uniref:hypothetical protein n=1 Tax=Aeromonas veronii TaxID=654 RepID=UPI0039C9C0EC